MHTRWPSAHLDIIGLPDGMVPFGLGVGCTRYVHV